MKRSFVLVLTVTLAVAGLTAVRGALEGASAASCPVTYVDATPCGNPTPTASASAAASVGIAAPAARVGTQCTVAAVKRRALFTVSSSTPVMGGSLQVKVHKVGTPSSTKRKFGVASYTGPVTKRLTPGLYHGTMVYVPAAGSSLQYCGIVFRNLRIKGAAKHRSAHVRVQLPTSVSAGLRSDAH